MSPAVNAKQARFVLRPFDPRHAARIARWVETDEDLLWVAPSARPPLTGEMVATWTRPGGRAFVLNPPDGAYPVAYGELNPMRGGTDNLWLGHVIVKPEQRGQGTGQTLVRGLLRWAFDRLSAKRAFLVVFPANKAAIACYRRVGFRIVGEEYHRFGGGPKRRLFRLEIDIGRSFRRSGADALRSSDRLESRSHRS